MRQASYYTPSNSTRQRGRPFTHRLQDGYADDMERKKHMVREMFLPHWGDAIPNVDMRAACPLETSLGLLHESSALSEELENGRIT